MIECRLTEIAKTKKELAQSDGQLERVISLYVSGDLSKSMLDKERSKVESKRKSIVDRLTTLESRLQPDMITPDAVEAELVRINESLKDVIENPQWVSLQENGKSFEEFVDALEDSSFVWGTAIPAIFEAYHLRVKVDNMNGEKVIYPTIVVGNKEITEKLSL